MAQVKFEIDFVQHCGGGKVEGPSATRLVSIEERCHPLRGRKLPPVNEPPVEGELLKSVRFRFFCLLHELEKAGHVLRYLVHALPIRHKFGCQIIIDHRASHLGK